MLSGQKTARIEFLIGRTDALDINSQVDNLMQDDALMAQIEKPVSYVFRAFLRDKYGYVVLLPAGPGYSVRSESE